MKKVILKVGGMTCSACSNHVEKYLNKQEGVIDASVNLVLGQALIHYEDALDLATLGKYIVDSGYEYCGIYDETLENKKDHSVIYLIILGILILFIMYISMGSMLHLPSIPFFDSMMHPRNYALILLILTIPYLVYGRDIIVRGLKNLINHSANMDTLVALGVSVSFIYSLVNTIWIFKGSTMHVHNLYFESVCMIILFIKLGRVIDSNSKEKTKAAIQGLVKVTPDSALLKNKDEEKEVTIDEVNVGDVLIVKPGMKVAVDGEVLKGQAHFDESFITGEANPIKKEKGDKLVAGSINYDGIIEYKALKIGPKSTISEMVHMVLEASNSKMPISRLADRVSSYFVPFIIILAILTLVVYLIIGVSFNEALVHMVTILVVACPCALGLATPLAVVVAIGHAYQNGLLIKTSATLETASHIDTIVFDKTGTLTYGQLTMNKLYNYSRYTDDELLNIVANIESNSTHPIAVSLTKYQTQPLKVNNYREMAGQGIKAHIKEKSYALGNEKIIAKIDNIHRDDAELLTKKGHSIVYIVEDEKIIGLIGVKDVIRKDAAITIKSLKKQGYNLIMLTGDDENTAQIIGQEIGIKNIKANCLPKEKNQYLEKLKQEGHKIIMVGDGINDAPSLTIADIGISFASSTDIATNAASVVITNDQLSNLLSFILLGRRTLVNIKENLFWAFLYNSLMIPIAMGLFAKWGIVINPMIASGAMMLSSLCVVFNALRLRNVKLS